MSKSWHRARLYYLQFIHGKPAIKNYVGTGMVMFYHTRQQDCFGEAMLCMREEDSDRVLLRSRVLLAQSSYKQCHGNVMTWCEVVSNVRVLALHFEEREGCRYIMQQIDRVQYLAHELMVSDYCYKIPCSGDDLAMSTRRDDNNHIIDNGGKGQSFMQQKDGIVANDEAQDDATIINTDTTCSSSSQSSTKGMQQFDGKSNETEMHHQSSISIPDDCSFDNNTMLVKRPPTEAARVKKKLQRTVTLEGDDVESSTVSSSNVESPSYLLTKQSDTNNSCDATQKEVPVNDELSECSFNNKNTEATVKVSSDSVVCDTDQFGDKPRSLKRKRVWDSLYDVGAAVLKRLRVK